MSIQGNKLRTTSEPDFKLTPRSIKILKYLKDHFREEPRRLYMHTWSVKRGKDYGGAMIPDDIDFPPCGTVGCIAGWICMLYGEKKEPHWLIAPQTAGEEMGFAKYPYCLNSLFYLEYWPNKFSKQFELAKTPYRRVEVTCNRIDHFIKNLE